MTVPPFVSIVVTNYNYSRYLETCLDSCVGQQTSVPFEVIVVDDGSTDGSVEIARSFEPRGVRVITRANGGIEAASNTGISAARGECFVRVDADDFLLSTYVETMAGEIGKGSAVFAYSDYVVVDEHDRQLYTDTLSDFNVAEVRARGDFLATGTLFRRPVFLAAGGYSETTRNCGLENYELILKLLESGAGGLHVPKPLFAYRRHALNISVTRKKEIVDYGRLLFSRFGLGPYRTNVHHPYKLVVNDE